ncbi:TNPO1 protein, partial [Cinclus mexicanus]|nr:TNPO1 protein [Cinclus mexicanus]
GILITTIASKGELRNWPDLLPKLCSLLDSEDYNTCEGAFGALQKICEDSAEILDSDVLDRPLNIMIPKFLQFFKHSNPPLKPVQVPLDAVPSLQCVDCTTHFGVVIKQISKELLDYAGRNDVSNQKIQDHILIVSLIFFGKLLLGILSTKDSSSKFFAKLTSSPSSPVLGLLCTVTDLPSSVYIHIHILIPVLVNGMKYSEIDIILLKGDVEEDEAIPDSEQDIRPRFHRSRTVAQPHEEDSIEDDDDDDDNDLDDDDTISDWNLS